MASAVVSLTVCYSVPKDDLSSLYCLPVAAQTVIGQNKLSPGPPASSVEVIDPWSI